MRGEVLAQRWGLALITVLAACGWSQAVEPDVRGREVIVVQALLSTESSTQTIWIERSVSIAATVGGGGPLSPPPSLVEVRDTLGGVFVFDQDMTTPVRYLATFTPVNGRRYALRISVGTQTLTASVIVPLPLRLLQPPTDTVILASRDSVVLAWTSGSSRHFGAVITRPAPELWDHPFLAGAGLQLDSTYSAYVALAPGVASPDTLLLWALAFDPQSWGYLYPQTSYDAEPVAGNVTGGAGIFGAVTADHVVVQVAP